MGSAGASLDDPQEQVEFWKTWNEATRDERHRMGVLIGKQTAKLMRATGRTAEDARRDLAKFVREVIIKRPASGASRKRR